MESGEGLQPLRTVDVRVCFKQRNKQLSLLIMRGTGCNVLGRDWFDPLSISLCGIDHVHQVHALSHYTGKTLSRVLRRPKLLQTPVFALARTGTTQAPENANSSVRTPACSESETSRLTDQGVIKPTQYLEWKTPVVVVQNKEKKNRQH